MHVYSVGLRYKVNKNVDVGGEFDRIQTESATYGDYANYLGLLQVRYLFDGRLTALK
jgi:long-subunit fatty acid transport protein